MKSWSLFFSHSIPSTYLFSSSYVLLYPLPSAIHSISGISPSLESSLDATNHFHLSFCYFQWFTLVCFSSPL